MIITHRTVEFRAADLAAVTMGECIPVLNSASLYKSPQGYHAMMRAYDAQLRRWTLPCHSRYVPTRFGDTHLLACGAEDAPPLVLIHGLAVNALVWKPNIAALSRHFRVYALDNIGDAGRSAPARPPLYGSAYADWLVDVFDALKIARANVIGISLGGWITLKLAIHAPERVERIVPLCPAGFVPYRLPFVRTALAAGLFPSDARIHKLRRALCAPQVRMSEENSEMLDLTIRHHRVKLVPLRPLSNAEVQSIRAPTLLLVGEHETIFSPQEMVARARRLIPDVQADIIPGAGHSLNSDQPDALHRRALAFLGAAAAF